MLAKTVRQFLSNEVKIPNGKGGVGEEGKAERAREKAKKKKKKERN